ncbi:hypothetical protein [Niallia taxi]|uniref:hypothetical protein n=1 Tax=Niallia taxi TaxID=2499688 RepID=UPI0015F3E601|nr:hypothetical protein [Niallia taxi]
MDKLVVGLLAVVILIGATFFVFNSDNGFNNGVVNGAETINSKVTGIDYDGNIAPGAGQAHNFVDNNN